jgi:hypothetical protein
MQGLADVRKARLQRDLGSRTGHLEQVHRAPGVVGLLAEEADLTKNTGLFVSQIRDR